MFSVTVAYVLFGFMSVVLPVALLDHFMNNPHKRFNPIKVTLFIVLWFVSGVYLFG